MLDWQMEMEQRAKWNGRQLQEWNLKRLIYVQKYITPPYTNITYRAG